MTTTELRDLPILAGLSDGALERLRACGEVQADTGQVLTREDDMEGVPEMLNEVQVEATFPDGTKLVTVHGPIS